MMRPWQVYALTTFGVAAGQVLRIGQKIEAGKPVTWRDLFVMCTLLPAFGSIAGAAAVHYEWSIPVALGAGVSAGWMGFATMRLILAFVRSAISQVSGTKGD